MLLGSKIKHQEKDLTYLTKKYDAVEISMMDQSLGIVKLILNRPDASNAFSDEMITELCRVLREADRDPDVRVIIVTGEGKHFCAGGDVKAMQQRSGMFAGESDELRKRYMYGIQQIPLTMESIETPVIAAINGAAIGAGLDFSCMCDIRLAGERAKFGETFTKLGLIPGDGGGFFLQRIIGYSKAMELTLTGEVFDAKHALEIGLVNRIFPNDSLLDEAFAFAKIIASNAPVAVKYSKKIIRQAYHDRINSHLEAAAAYQGVAQRTHDHFEGVSALLEKRPAKFEGK